jgi:hypothetical protein
MENFLWFLSALERKERGRTIFKYLLLEIYFGKNNIIAFCVSQILPNNKKFVLTNLYSYPSSNIVWLMVQELRTQQYLEPRELYVIANVCFLFLYALDKLFLFSKKKHISKRQLIQTLSYLAIALERQFPSVRINLM